MSEIWKDVVGYEGRYQVSNLGNVRSVPRVTCHGQQRSGQLLRPATDPRGYLRVSLYKDGHVSVRTVHSLVAEAFVEGRAEGLEVCHGDDVKSNNVATNLRWDTRKANAADKVANGRSAAGARNGRAKLNEAQVAEIRVKLEAGAVRNHLRKEYGVSFNTIERIASGETWSVA